MKHPASRDFFDYWQRQRGYDAAPDRHRIEPGAVRHVLADSFVLAYESGYPFRTAGTRLCALFGNELTGTPFLELWDTKSRKAVSDLIADAALQMRPTVAGVAAANDAGFLSLELLLLPFARQVHMPRSLTGLLAPLSAPVPGHHLRRELILTSWRDLDTLASRPRSVQRRHLGSGFTVYEGRDHNA
jgi:hypothetical protein